MKSRRPDDRAAAFFCGGPLDRDVPGEHDMLDFWAVSDVAETDLEAFERAFVAATE